MNRIAAGALLLAATGIATFIFKFLTADQYERSCGLSNIFMWDYSDEIRKDIRLVKNGSDVAIDFSNLKRWNRICLTSMYEDEFSYPGPFSGGVEHLNVSYRVGKWQCSQGPERTITILLTAADRGGLARQLALPPELTRNVHTDYGAYKPTENFRQCADIANAVAKCEEIPRLKPGQCMLMFPNIIAPYVPK